MTRVATRATSEKTLTGIEARDEYTDETRDNRAQNEENNFHANTVILPDPNKHPAYAGCL